MSALACVKVVRHRAGQNFLAWSPQVAVSTGSPPQEVESWYIGLTWSKIVKTFSLMFNHAL